jgi:hypothetical protein
MKAFSRIILFSLLSILIQKAAIAQQYPITASTQIIPPYSVYLPDYAVPGSDKLRVILVQNDLTQPSYEVRLRMTVEMNGTVIMRTSPAFTPKPLSLSAGVPTIISGADLYDYLNSNNIDFSGGFSRETYDRTKALPEGAYRISFTAYDYRRSEVQVSNTGGNVFFFQKSEPPVLNQPVCDSRVVKIDPQFLTFNWSSRNTPNPLEGSGVEYVFALYEIKPKNSNPDYIIRSTKALYTTTTESNTLIYGPGEPQLIDSMDYVWIVQARDKSGRDMYSNQGYSRSCKFSYLSNNPFAVNNIGKPVLSAEATAERTAKLWWSRVAGNSMYRVEAYRVQYRAAGKDFDWFTEEKQSDTTLSLYNLEPSHAYEAQLQYRVAGVYGPFSDVVTFTTPALRTFTCGESPQLGLPQNSQLLPIAVVGMPVKIGHFDVMLTDVSGSNGVFSGKGRIITPGFGMGLLMEFKGITINTDLVVIKGEMQAVTDGIDKFVSDAVKEQRGGSDVGQVKTGDIVPDVTTTLHIFSKDNIVVNTEDGTITLKDSNTGQQEVINYKEKGKTLPLVLEDADGNLYNIDKNGKVTSAGTRDKSLAGNTAALNTLQLDSGMVTFSAVVNSRFAFDAWKTSYEGKSVLDSSYEKLANGKYRVSAKALVPGEQEDVIATLSNAGSINTDKIKFVSGKGIVYPSKKNGTTWTITLTGGPASDAQEVFAVYPKSDGKYISMGKLLVVSYAPLQNKVVLIPVGVQTQVPEEAIRNSLAKAYGKIGVSYTVSTDTSFQSNTDWDDNMDGLLQDTKSAFLGSGFTGEEKSLKNLYKRSHVIDDNTTYLFFVNEAALKDGDLLGKMPRQSQFGFLFVKNASAEDVGRTVAHETGHGAYTLEHVFSNAIGLSTGTTDNLMDYTKGYELLKYQWDVIHSPGHVWGIFEGDDASASVGYADIKVFDKLKNKGDTYTFITPSGKYITLPSTASNLKFSTLDRTFEAIKDVADLSKPTENLIPLGALISFKDNSIVYNARFVGTDFTGYAKSETEYYIDKYSKQLAPATGIAVVLGIEQNKFVTYASRFKSVWPDVSVTDTDYKGFGSRLATLSVIEMIPATETSTLLDIINLKKTDILLTLTASNLSFTNDKIKFKYNLNTNVSLNDFLLEVLSEKSTLSEYISYFTLANLKENELQAFSSCLSDVNQMDLGKIRAAIGVVSQALREGKYVNSDAVFGRAKLRTLEELIKLANADIDWLKKLKDAVQAKASSTVVNKIFTEKYYACSLAGLNITERKYLLNQLLAANGDNDYWYTDPSTFSSDDGHFIVKDLVNSTPDFDKVALLKEGFMANNYEWMRTLWRQANKWMNGVGYDEVHAVFDTINPWISSNFTALNIKPTQKTFSFSMFGISSTPYFPGESDYVIGLKGGEVYSIGNNREYSTMGISQPGEVEFNDNGKISFKQNYILADVSPIVYETGKAPDRRTNIYYDESYDPFEPITMLVGDNYHEDGLDAGDRFILPAYMAMVYDNDVRRTSTGRTVRKVGNVVTIGVAILSAPETGGTSLAMISLTVTRVAAAVATADMFIQGEKSKLTTEQYAEHKDFYEAWDKIKTVTDYASLSVGAANGLKWGWTKFGSMQKITTTVTEVTTTLKNIPAGLNALKSGWAKLQGLTTATSASKIAINESKLYTGSKLFVDNFDEIEGAVTDAGKVLGFNDEFTQASAIISKNSGGSGYDDYMELFSTPLHSPKLPAGSTASDVELLTRPAAVTAIKELVTANEFKRLEEEFSIFAKHSAEGVTFSPASYTKATAVRYVSVSAVTAPATEVAPEAIVITLPGEAPQLVYANAKVAARVIEKVKEQNKCKRCERFTQSICEKFETLQASAGVTYTAAVSKLCANLPFSEVSADLDYLLALDKPTLYKFLDNIIITSDKTQHISNKVNQIDVRTLEAWRLMRQAKESISINYQTDFDALREIRIARADPTFNSNVGNDDGLKALLTANKGLNCYTCENRNKFIQFADDYVKDFKYFSDNYNIASIWNELKQPKALRMVYGAAFQIRILRAYPELFTGGTLGFDKTIDDVEADDPGEDAEDNDEVRSKCRYDIKIMIPGNDKLYEFKSWGKSMVSDFKNNASKRVYFAKQLRTYLDKTNNLNNLMYIFDGRRITELESKAILQKVLIDNVDAWFGAGGYFGPSKLAMFGYNNLADFKAALNDLDSDIYSFVKAYN